MTEAEFLGGIAVVIMILAYGVQLWQMYNGKSEPHPIAWLGFGFLTGVGFAIQVQKGAGAGAWVMGWTAGFCFLIGFASLYKTRWHFDRWDWTALVAGVGLFLIYLVSKNLSWGPYVSAVLATTADLVLYIPIFKNTWMLPRKENATAYGLNSLKFVPSLFAMGEYSVETCLYPSTMIVINASVVFFLLWRRNRLTRQDAS